MTSVVISHQFDFMISFFSFTYRIQYMIIKMQNEFLSLIIILLLNYSLVDCSKCSPKSSLKMQRRIDIHFVRHGETTANRDNILVR